MRWPSSKWIVAALWLAMANSGAFKTLAATGWPQFRGPNCSGVSESDKPPVEFGPATNLLWKTALPPGLSSPCIWEDRIFLTALETGKLHTLCLRRRDGKMLWRQVAPAEGMEEVNPTSSPASATPATDGKRVYVYFGSYGVLAYDLEGRERWRRSLPMPGLINGSGTSPAIMENLLIINRDQEEGKSSLLALDGNSGRTVWETPRPEARSSYTTPIVWRHDGAQEVVLAGSFRVVGYGLKDGREQWSARGLEAVSVCPTPVIGDGRLYAMSRSFGGANLPSFSKTTAEMDKNEDGKIAGDEARGMLANKPLFTSIDNDKDGFVNEQEWNAATALIAKGEHGIFALRAPGTGDVTESHLAWKQKRGVPVVSSPLFYRSRMHIVQDGGRVTCYEAATGKALYEQERLGADGEYFASPVAADGKVYFASTRGTVSVIEAGDTLKVLARNDLGERIMTTPAIANNKLYVRTATNLWAFGR